MQLQSKKFPRLPPPGNSLPTQPVALEKAPASTATKPPPWSSDVAVAMDRLLGSGLVEPRWIKPPYEGTNVPSSVPKPFLFGPQLQVHYPVKMALQFIAALESTINRDRIGKGWHDYLTDCLTLVRESDDVRQQPTLWTDAVKAANLIVEEANADIGHTYWLSFGMGSSAFGVDLNNAPLNPNDDGALVIPQACWPDALLPQQPFQQLLNNAFPVNDSNLHPVHTEPAQKRQKTFDHWGAWSNASQVNGGLPPQPYVANPVSDALLALQRSILLRPKSRVAEPLELNRQAMSIALPDHFPQLPENRSDALNVILRLLVAIEDAIDDDELEALLKKEPNCSDLLLRCQHLLPHLSELIANEREAMDRLIQGLRKLIHHHVATHKPLDVV